MSKAAARQWEADMEGGTAVGRAALLMLRVVARHTGNHVKPELAAVLRRDRLAPEVVVEVGRTAQHLRRQLLASSSFNGAPHIRQLLLYHTAETLEAVRQELREAAMREAVKRPAGEA